MRPPCPTSARRCRIPPSPRRRSPGCSRPGASASPTSQRSWTFDALPDYDAELFTNKKSKTNPEVSRRMLEAVLPALDGLADWTVDGIHDALIGLAESLEVKTPPSCGRCALPRRARRSPAARGGDLPHSGKDECLRRLRLGLDKLGG